MLKKAFTALTVLATVVYTVGLAAFVPTASAATSGSLIKASGAAVYYMGGDGKRYVFPDQKTYFTWYSDFSSVITISDAELAAIQIGGNVTARPGVKLVKITTDPKVYAVGANGSLHWITTEAIAVALYGANWASMVNDVPDAFFVNYTVGSSITDASQYSPSAATAAATSINVDKGIGTDTGITLPSGSVTVSLAGDTPSSQTVPTEASVEVLKFNLRAGSSSAAVSGITLTAGGLGDPKNITDATLYVDGVKAGASKNFNSDRIATFTFATPISIAANATKTVSVRATFSDSKSGSNNGEGFYTVGIAGATGVTAGGSVSGSFPVNGNTIQATNAVNASLGQVSLTNNQQAANVNADFGQDDVELVDITLNASNEDVLFTTATFENGGTNNPDLLQNVRMLINGQVVSTGSISGKLITFNLNNFLISKDGGNYDVTVVGDIGVGNTTDTIKLYVRNRSDLTFIGQQYGYGVQISTGDHASIDSATDAIQVAVQASDFIINFDKTATPAKDVLKNTKQVVLGTLSMQSNGENATVRTMDDAAGNFRITGTNIDNNDIENVELYDVNTGGRYSVTATFVTNRYELVLADTDIPLTRGVKKTFHVRADVTTNAENGDIYAVELDGAAMDVVGDVSNATLGVTPSNVKSANTSVKAGSLDVTPVALTNTTVVPGATDVTIYQALLKAGTADDIRLNSIKVSATDASNLFTDNNISQLRLYVDGKLLRTLSNQIVEGNPATITFNSLSTVNSANVIAKGATANLIVVASFSSSFSGTLNNAFTTRIVDIDTDINSRSVSGNEDIVETPAGNYNLASRAVTLAASGNLSVEMKTTSAKANRNTYTRAGATTAAGEYLAEIVFTTQNEAVKVTDLRLDMYNASFAVAATGASAVAGDLTATADTAGTAANGYDIIINAGGADTTGVVVASSNAGAITLTVESDGGGAADPTWADIVAAINGDGTAGPIVTVASTNGTDTFLVGDAQTITLAGGVDAGTATATGADISYVHLVDGSGNIVATDAVDAAGNAYFENVNLVFEGDKSTSLWLVVQTKGINVNGDATSTATDGKTIVYVISSTNGVEAEGVNTAETITMVEDTNSSLALGEWSDATVASKTTTVLGAKITAIQNALSDGSLSTGGDRVIAKFTVTADAGGNRKKTDNTNIEAKLHAISLALNTDVTGLTDVKMYVEGSQTQVAATNNNCTQLSGSCDWTAAELADLVNGGFFSGTITLVVTGDLITGADESLSMSIDDLAGGDFQYQSTDGNVTTTVTNTLLPYISVPGATLRR